ncbi:hypothetical protein EYF80_020673 [Liparis tanakae]|uniref:Uncharacterized protein n=1 Tax=Liparis tanakae TaxID=230148 RepID=A0A4Z2HTV9_9TELE|nr:hypothetical protein EYF80_020673 [Liparis tanakae]
MVAASLPRSREEEEEEEDTGKTQRTGMNHVFQFHARATNIIHSMYISSEEGMEGVRKMER